MLPSHDSIENVVIFQRLIDRNFVYYLVVHQRFSVKSWNMFKSDTLPQTHFWNACSINLTSFSFDTLTTFVVLTNPSPLPSPPPFPASFLSRFFFVFKYLVAGWGQTFKYMSHHTVNSCLPSIFWVLCIEVSTMFRWMFGQGERKPVFIGQFVGVLVRRNCSVATLQICITTEDANKQQQDNRTVSVVPLVWTNVCAAACSSL